MPAKQVQYEHEARLALQRGVNQLANCVSVTLGPRGRTVALQKSFGSPLVVDDGVTIAKEIELEDRFENMGALLVREVATKTKETAGDGSTTAIILTRSMLSDGMRLTASGCNPVELRKGLERATSAVVEELRKRSRPVKGREDTARIAALSANDTKIGEIVADVIDAIGKDGITTVEDGKGVETTFEVVKGLRFDKGYISPYFITDPAKMMCVLEDPLILFYEKKISAAKDLLPILEAVVRSGKPFVAIAEDVDGEALATLVLNRLRAGLQCAAVKSPGFGERRKAMMEDMAILCGGTFLSTELGIELEHAQLSHLGTCKRIEITKDHTTIVEGKGDKSKIEQRITQIEHLMEQTDSKYDREKYQERIGKLRGGVAVIQVGAATETAMKEKKVRIEDALGATRAAIEEGVVAGGGAALAQASAIIPKLGLEGDAAMGASIVQNALTAPLRQLAINSGLSADLVVEKVLSSPENTGLNVETLQYVDMMKAGIVDPLKVVRLALENASSIVGMMLTTEATVAEIPEKEEKKQTPPRY